MSALIPILLGLVLIGIWVFLAVRARGVRARINALPELRVSVTRGKPGRSARREAAALGRENDPNAPINIDNFRKRAAAMN